MKKLLISVMTMVAIAAQAASFQSLDFINGKWLFMTNNTTIKYGYTNVEYVGSDFMLRQANANSNIVPVVYFGSTQQPLINKTFTDPGATIYFTNSFVVNTNNLWPSAWTDVGLFADVNGNAAAATLSVVVALDGVAATNQITLVFDKEPDGVNPAANSSGNLDTLTLVLNPTGNTNWCQSTNLPSSFTGGAGAVRLRSIAAVNSTTNSLIWFKKISLNGWVP